MDNNSTTLEKLFSYGTLRYESVQFSTFGRKLEGVLDSLPGYQLGTVKIEDQSVVAASGENEHPIVSYTGDPKHQVAGMVFDITVAELAQADAYEVDAYKRIRVKLASGTSAWVYVNAADIN